MKGAIHSNFDHTTLQECTISLGREIKRAGKSHATAYAYSQISRRDAAKQVEKQDNEARVAET